MLVRFPTSMVLTAVLLLLPAGPLLGAEPPPMRELDRTLWWIFKTGIQTSRQSPEASRFLSRTFLARSASPEGAEGSLTLFSHPSIISPVPRPWKSQFLYAKALEYDPGRRACLIYFTGQNRRLEGQGQVFLVQEDGAWKVDQFQYYPAFYRSRIQRIDRPVFSQEEVSTATRDLPPPGYGARLRELFRTAVEDDRPDSAGPTVMSFLRQRKPGSSVKAGLTREEGQEVLKLFLEMTDDFETHAIPPHVGRGRDHEEKARRHNYVTLSLPLWEGRASLERLRLELSGYAGDARPRPLPAPDGPTDIGDVEGALIEVFQHFPVDVDP